MLVIKGVSTPAQEPPTVWTIQRVIQWTSDHFSTKGIDTARLDAELLLSSVLKCDRIYLYTHFDKPLHDKERAAFRALVKRRAAREPIAYILGEREFFGRAFYTTPYVLIPRPETEHLIEYAVPWLQAAATKNPQGLNISGLRGLDIGTGSGCIAISLLAEMPRLNMLATDISPEALSVARTNAKRHHVDTRIEFLEGDLLEPIQGESFDIVLSNPPYVEDTAEVRAELEADVLDFEPPQALFAGCDGLSIVRRLLTEIPRVLRPGGLFLCEFGHTHGEVVLGLMRDMPEWRESHAIKDLQGYVRAVAAETFDPAHPGR